MHLPGPRSIKLTKIELLPGAELQAALLDEGHLTNIRTAAAGAVAAKHLIQTHGLSRVLILDFDIHHGNGTQNIFYEDETVLFASMHLFAPFFYPGIGGLHEVGTRKGAGFTVNVPFPPGVGDVGYLRVIKEYISPLVRKFQPEIMLISIGLDAHWQDPLAMAALSLTGYSLITQSLVRLADGVCNGRLLFVLEGGYKIDVLTLGIANTYSALLGYDAIRDPIGTSPVPERDVTQLLETLISRDLQD